MARITVNESGTNPVVLISTTVGDANALIYGNIGSNANANVIAETLSVTCLQDITITSSTGVYSYVDFCNKDVNKLTTPADNEIAMNIVIDDVAYFGNTSAAANTAGNRGIANISQNKVPVQFLVVWNYSNVSNVLGNSIQSLSNVYYSSGKGYITNLAPTAAPDAPVYVTPISIAVDGTMYSSRS